MDQLSIHFFPVQCVLYSEVHCKLTFELRTKLTSELCKDSLSTIRGQPIMYIYHEHKHPLLSGRGWRHTRSSCESARPCDGLPWQPARPSAAPGHTSSPTFPTHHISARLSLNFEPWTHPPPPTHLVEMLPRTST